MQAEIDDGVAVHTLIVEQLGEVGSECLLAGLIPEATVLNGDFFEPILGDEDSKDTLCEIVLSIVLLTALLKMKDGGRITP
ncbi:hypothetical protein [Halorubrum trueperi]|uniref:Uncharacterized protein n=1 Tax=Halorubrum trueperi TaxID=2004704 RepID=A0ABD5ULY7_9EURY